MDHASFAAACRLLGLGERASLREIKQRYRSLARRQHPDSGGDQAAMTRLNAAYRILLDYCGNYRYALSREEFFEQCPEERLREQFRGDPIWGGGED